MLHKMMNDEELAAYEAGKDSHINGPSIRNCHFGFFSTPEKTKAWEKGVADAKEQECTP